MVGTEEKAVMAVCLHEQAVFHMSAWSAVCGETWKRNVWICGGDHDFFDLHLSGILSRASTLGSWLFRKEGHM